MSVNYVVSCWSGKRRVNPPECQEDPPIFLKYQLRSLERFATVIDQVTFVFAENPKELKSYSEFVKSIPPRIGKAKTEILRRPNIGISFGAYHDAFKAFGDKFEHFILTEDDYVFLEEGFDRKLVEAISRNPKIGLTSFVLEPSSREMMMNRAVKEVPPAAAKRFQEFCPESFAWPRVMIGIARSKALRDVVTRFGELPHAKNVVHSECKFLGQFGLPLAIQKVGWTISDRLPEVRVEAFGPQGQILRYGPPDKALAACGVQIMASREETL
jgi:hypothetical protein